MPSLYGINSPLGPLSVELDEHYIYRLTFLETVNQSSPPALYYDLKNQLASYFRGDLTRLSLPIKLKATEFQRKVYTACQEIPYGKTATYGEIAKRIASPSGARAVGGALNRNPVPILIPCHRIVARNGLGGYAFGLDKKIQLLRLENKIHE